MNALIGVVAILIGLSLGDSDWVATLFLWVIGGAFIGLHLSDLEGGK